MPSWLSGYGSGAGYRKAITIDHTVPTGTLTNFSKLFEITSDAALGAHCDASGNSIRFTTSDGTTLLDYGIVSFSISGGLCTAIFHVNVPTIDNSTDKTLYLYYKSSGSAGQNKAAAIDSNTVGYWPGEDNPTGSANDDPNWAGSNHGSTVGSMANVVAGQIGNALTFDGSNDKSTVDGIAAGIASGSVTVRAIIKTTNNTLGQAVFALNDGPSSNDLVFHLGVLTGVGGTSGKIALSHYTGSGFSGAVGGTTLASNTLYHVVGRFDSSGGTTVFVNGVSDATNANTSRGGSASTHARFGGSSATSNSFMFNGLLDERLVVAGILSDAWIAYDYTDQFSNSSTFSLGAEEVEGIIFDAASNSGYQAAQSSYSWSHTCGGIDRFLAVDVSLLSAGATVSSITYNGVALSLIGARSTVTSFGRIEQWGLVAPASGSHTIAVTLSSSIASAGTAVSYANVQQTSPTESFNSNQATNAGSATDASVVVTPATPSCIIHAALVTNDTSVTANQTSRNNVTGAVGSGANEDTGPITPATATTLSYTGEGIVATWAIAGYAIRPVTASAGTSAISGSASIVYSTGTCTLTGNGGLTGSAILVFGTGTCTLAGSGTLTSTSTVTLGTGTCTLTGVGSLIGSSALVVTTGTCSLKGSGVLTGSATIAFTTGTCTLLGSGPLTGTSSLAFSVTSTLTGTGTLTGSSSLALLPGTCLLSGSGVLSGSSSLAVSTGTCTLTGAGLLTGTSTLTFTASATPFGAPTYVSGSASLILTGSSTLTGLGTLAGTSSVIASSTATIRGTVQAVGTGALTFTVSASPQGSGALVGASPLIVTAVGTGHLIVSISGTSAILISGAGIITNGPSVTYYTTRIIIDNNLPSVTIDVPTERLVLDNQ